MLSEQFEYYYISAAGTYTVCPVPCTLGYITIPLATTGTIKVIDGTGTTENIALFGAGSVGGTYTFKVTVGTQLKVITSSSSDKVTLAFRIK